MDTKNINFNQPITIYEIYSLMDGGSTIIKCADINNLKFEIELHQHMSITSSHENKLPGRIYLNGKLVTERGELEKSILFGLEHVFFINTINNKETLIEKIKYIRSESFISNNKIMSDKSNHLFGREFDWFAIDKDYNFGVFSTAGSAIAPIYVIENHKEHDKIFDLIELPNNHSEKVWGDISKHGFYVFDWEPHEGSFIKRATPISKMSKDLKKQLLNLRSLAKLDISFQELNTLNPKDLKHTISKNN